MYAHCIVLTLHNPFGADIIGRRQLVLTDIRNRTEWVAIVFLETCIIACIRAHATDSNPIMCSISPRAAFFGGFRDPGAIPTIFTFKRPVSDCRLFGRHKVDVNGYRNGNEMNCVVKKTNHCDDELWAI